MIARDLFDQAFAYDVRGGLRLGAAQRIGLRFAAALRHGFSEVREQHREPEPQSDLQVEAEVSLVTAVIREQQHRREDAADFYDEHDGVLHHGGGIEFDERVDTGAAHDLRVEERALILVSCCWHRDLR